MEQVMGAADARLRRMGVRSEDSSRDYHRENVRGDHSGVQVVRSTCVGQAW